MKQQILNQCRKKNNSKVNATYYFVPFLALTIVMVMSLTVLNGAYGLYLFFLTRGKIILYTYVYKIEY